MPQQELAKQQRVKSANTQSLDPLAHPLESHHPAPTVAPMPSSGLSQATLQRAKANPRTLASNEILQLQRTIGNRAVQRMLNAQAKPAIQRDREDGIEARASFEAGGEYNPASSQGKHLLAHELTHTIQQGGSQPVKSVQTKLQVGAATDRYEQEADRVASKVTQSHYHATPQSHAPIEPSVTPVRAGSRLGPSIQRKMKIDRKQLNILKPGAQGRLSNLAGKSGVVGTRRKETDVGKLDKALTDYWATRRAQEEVTILEIIVGLADKWLQTHDTKSSEKHTVISDLLAASHYELLTARKQAAYMADLTGKGTNNFQYISSSVERSKVLSATTGAVNGHAKSNPVRTAAENAEAARLITKYELTDAELGAIKVYSVDDYKYINPALEGADDRLKSQIPFVEGRKDADTSAKGVAKAKEEGIRHGEMALAGLSKLPDVKGNVFRGMTLPRDVVEGYAIGEKLEYNSFKSSSLDEKVSQSFIRQELAKDAKLGGTKVGVLFIMKVTEKAKDVSTFSHAPTQESEVLMLPGTRFLITDFKRIDDLHYHITAEQQSWKGKKADLGGMSANVTKDDKNEGEKTKTKADAKSALPLPANAPAAGARPVVRRPFVRPAGHAMQGPPQRPVVRRPFVRPAQPGIARSAVSSSAPAPLLQREREDGQEGFAAGKEFESQLSRGKGGGAPLPKQTKESFESSFGANFSNVRIHADAASDQLSRSIQAKAFTHGNDIHFGAGEYNPASSQGKHLLAHELTHTIQQTGGKKAQGVQPKMQVGAANDRYEQEANRVAASISTSATAAMSRPKGGAAGKVQPMAAPAVQRMMNFKLKELEVSEDKYAPAVAQNQKEKVSTGRKVANKLGYESNYQQIKNTLAMYWQARGDMKMQKGLLDILKVIAENYIKNQRHRKKQIKRIGGGRDFKNQAVARLKAAIEVELSKLERRKESHAFLAEILKSELGWSGKDPMGAGKQIAHNRKYGTSDQQDSDATVMGKSGWGGVHNYGISDKTGEKEFRAHKRYKEMGLDTTDRMAITLYTGKDFGRINPAAATNLNWFQDVLKKEKAIANGRGPYAKHDPSTDLKWVNQEYEIHRKLSAATIAALKKLPDWKHKGRQLYRTETISEKDAANMAVGHQKNFESFVSTSQLREKAERFAKDNLTTERPWSVMYEVAESKNGKDIEELSQSPYEREVLFLPNTTFKVTAIVARDPAKKFLTLRVEQV